MTKRMTRIKVGVAAAALTLGLGAGAFTAIGQAGDLQAGSGVDRRGGPGGRGRMGPGGGPMGPLAGLPLRQLELTEPQREQVRVIMESHAPELKAIHDRIHAEVLQLLTPEQLTKLKEIEAGRPDRPNRR